METKASVAYSTLKDSFRAGVEMTSEALSSLNKKSCSFALVFGSYDHNPRELIKGVVSIIGDKIKFAGGTSTGIITNDYLGYEGYHAGIMLFSSDEVYFDHLWVENMKRGAYIAGKEMGQRLSQLKNLTNPNLLLFYDTIRPESDGLMPFYEATPILDGIRSEITEMPPIAGVGIMSGLNKRETKMWDHKRILNDAILSLVLSGKIKMQTTIMHGCKPASDYHKITRASGNVVLEMDNKPALEVAAEYLGNPEDYDWQSAPYIITLGMNKGEKYEEFKEKNYVNRMVLAADVSTGGFVLMEGDLREGDNIQFMRRCIETDTIYSGAMELLNSLNGEKPLFAFYISCLGRIKKIFGTEKEEAEEVQRAIGEKIPLFGIYSGVEIAKIGNDIMPLDWTGVLCIFSQPNG